MDGPERMAWLEERRKGIGGSDWSNALSLEPYGCQRQLIYDKRGIEPDFPEGEPEGYLIRGNKLEALVVEEAEQKLDIKTRRQKKLARPAWLPDWWIGNVDRMVVGGGVLEAKTKNPWVFKKLKSDGIPMAEIAQMQHYMALSGRDDCVYAALEPVSWELYVDVIVRNDELIDKMIADGRWLWEIVLDEDLVMPERLKASSKQCKRCSWRWHCQGDALFNGGGEASEPVDRPVLTDAELVELVREAYTLKELVAEAKARLDTLKEQVKEKLGGPQKVAIDGHAINWSKHEVSKFQVKEFKKAYPALASAFTKKGPQETFRWD